MVTFLKRAFLSLSSFDVLKRISDFAGVMTRLGFLAVFFVFISKFYDATPKDGNLFTSWLRFSLSGARTVIGITFACLSVVFVFFSIRWATEHYLYLLQGRGVIAKCVFISLFVVSTVWSIGVSTGIVYALVRQGVSLGP